MRALILLLIASPAFANGFGNPADANAEAEAEATSSLTSQDKRQAPAISAPPVYASGVCAVGASGGISTPVGGISGGKVTFDESCNRRELARVLTPLNPALALALLCRDPLLAFATDGQCTLAEPPAAGLKTSLNPSGEVTETAAAAPDEAHVEQFQTVTKAAGK